MSHRVVITKTVLAEIEHAFDWLAEHNPPAAEKWRDSLLAAIDELEQHPLRYPLAPESEWYPGELRQLLFGKRRGAYRVLFEIYGKRVYIVRVRHGAQDLLKADDF